MQDSRFNGRSLCVQRLLACLLAPVMLVASATSAQTSPPHSNAAAVAPSQPAATTPPSGDVTPPPSHGHLQPDWKQTLNEEFRGDKLGHCWKTSYIHNVHTLANNKEQEWYATPGDDTGFHPFHLSNGILSIKAVPAASQPHANAHGYPYLSGMIMNDGCFSQAYGYFEIRVKVPKGKGLWPAFWLLPTSHTWPPEADVFEMFGAPNSRHEGGVGLVHTGTVAGGIHSFNNWHKVPINQYEDFHTYGLLWGPQTMAIYIDGALITSQPTPRNLHEPMYLIANLAVGGSWAESPDAATPFPAIMQIDSIRAWQYTPWRHTQH